MNTMWPPHTMHAYTETGLILSAAIRALLSRQCLAANCAFRYQSVGKRRLDRATKRCYLALMSAQPPPRSLPHLTRVVASNTPLCI